MKNLLKRIPYTAIGILYLLWLAFDVYSFHSSSTSELGQKITQITQAKAEKKQLDERAQQALQAEKLLELKKVELRQLSTELAEMQTSFTDTLDVPGFLRLITTEGKKVNLRLSSVKPSKGDRAEFWVAHNFDVSFNGVYAQVVGFIQRLSQVQYIVRVDTLEVKRVGSPDRQLVELKGTLRITAYTYNPSAADERVREMNAHKEAGKSGG